MKISHINKTALALLVTAILMSASSCKKWLDVQPVTRLEREGLFKTEEGYRDALIGVYANLSGPSLYGREMTFATMDVLTGYYSPGYTGNAVYYQFYNSYPYKRNNPYKNDFCVGIINTMWSGMYNQIANLNSMLESIDGSRSIFSDNNYAILKGEAIALRAFLHLDLLRMYGPGYLVDPSRKCIPFVDTLSSLVMPLKSVEELSGRIIAELKTALQLMEKDPIRTGETPSTILASAIPSNTLPPYHNRRYHFNYYAVKAALARTYLWRGDKANALKYAKEVIAEQAARFPWVLDENLTAMSSLTSAKKDRTFTTEHIFALNIRDLELYIPDFFSTAGASSFNPTVLPTTASVKNSIYENNNVDPRSQYLFTPNAANFFSSKLYQGTEVSVWFKYQVPIIRITEMYYIAAECEASVGDGLNWLNVVRKVRKLSALSPSSINTPDALLTEIQKEYQKEFIGEGQLWYFYKRLNYQNLPYASRFTNRDWYVFDMPDDEYTSGGR